MAVSDGDTVTVVKDMGLVTTVFDERTLSGLAGHLAIGHRTPDALVPPPGEKEARTPLTGARWRRYPISCTGRTGCSPVACIPPTALKEALASTRWACDRSRLPAKPRLAQPTGAGPDPASPAPPGMARLAADRVRAGPARRSAQSSPARPGQPGKPGGGRGHGNNDGLRRTQGALAPGG